MTRNRPEASPFTRHVEPNRRTGNGRIRGFALRDVDAVSTRLMLLRSVYPRDAPSLPQRDVRDFP
jgi:hypothetical protein